MATVQLFLSIINPGLDNKWNKGLTSILKAMIGVEQVMIIEHNESSNAQISVSYKVDELSFTRIEKLVVDSGATITEINIHFPSGVTGVADPYRASAISITVDEKMKKIDGVLGAAISSKGEIKVVLDTTVKDKQVAIDEILKNM